MARLISFKETVNPGLVGLGLGLLISVATYFMPTESQVAMFVISLVMFLVGFRNQATRRNYRLGGWFETVADENDPGPHPFTIGLALGTMPVWVVTLAIVAYHWIPSSVQITIGIVVALMITWRYNGLGCQDGWIWLCQWVGGHWYGSRVQIWILEHEGGFYLCLGLSLLAGSLGVLYFGPKGWMTILISCVGMIFGAVFGLCGLGAKMSESEP